MSRHQNAGQNQNINVTNTSFENVAQFKYFGTTVTNPNPIHEEIKSRLNLGNTYCHSVQKLYLLALLFCVGVKFNEKKNLSLRAFENKVLKRIFGSKREKLTGKWRKLYNEAFSIRTFHEILSN
jgi:hypothetical protein